MNETYQGYVMIKLRHPYQGMSPKAASANPGTVQAQPSPADQMRLSQKLGGSFVSGMTHAGWTLWKTSSNLNPAQAAELVKDDPAVACAEPLNHIYLLDMPIPNDPDWDAVENDPSLVIDLTGGDNGDLSFQRLWNLRDTNCITSESGSTFTGAWDVYPGQWYTAANKPKNGPLIAFIDTGCDTLHPDFKNAGGAGTDVNQGGQIYTSMSHYFKYGEVSNAQSINDTNGHGTHVAGIAIAAGNNGSFDSHGVVGIGYNSRGMILRVFDDFGTGTDMDAAGAIFYAADHHADIINLSLGTTNYSQIFQDAVTYAWQKGTLVVCAGNESGSGGGNLGPTYPAACSGALAVTANAAGLYPADDNYAGSGNYVCIAAPGGDVATDGFTYAVIQYVFSTACENPCDLSENPSLTPPYTLDYTYLVGTSMACPHVSGAAGLWYGKTGLRQGSGFANLQAFQAIENSAMPTNAIANGSWEPTQGYGSLDCLGLLTLDVNPNPRAATVGSVKGIVYYGGTPIANVRVTAQAPTGGIKFQTTTLQDGTYRFDGIPPGTYNVVAAPFGSSHTRALQVNVGCDFTGADFYCGPAVYDDGGPTFGFFNYVSGTTRDLYFNQWVYDTDTGIDSTTVQVGSTATGTDLYPKTQFFPGTTNVHVHLAHTLPTQHFTVFTYTSGQGVVAHATHGVWIDGQDAYVSDATPSGDFVDATLKAQSGGTNTISYVTFDLTSVNKNVQVAKLVLTGSAPSTVKVGIFGTDNSTWDTGSLTWSARPTLNASPIAEKNVSTSGGYAWDITSFIQQAKTNNLSSVTLAIKADSNTASPATFNSVRAGGMVQPHLQVNSYG
ncbi:MAG TPA: S8 family serine peptidase [Fimbriimonas sp.]|nr:S8 family serine peptidase [Fimbriimonas sp.]